METPPAPLAKAIDAWRSSLGADAVVAGSRALEAYTQSVCATSRQVVAVLKPASPEEVQKLVATANEFRIALYPVSCGKQWGMGSRLPVQDGAAIVDLGRMNRIIEVNARFHYAVVEPGVTQRQLLDHIREHNLPLMLNVTGSTSDTSLVGNAMDRGIGYFDSRAHGISNMAVVLGNGETLQTGFGHYENAKTKNLYHYGVGPDLTGVFQQGNFGIVVSACIDLMPKPEEHMAVIARIDSEGKLPALVDALARLRARGVFLSVAHIGNRERSYITLAPLLYEQLVEAGEPEGEASRAKAVQMLEKGGFGPWSAAIGVLGTKAQVKLARKEFKKGLGGVAKVMFLNDTIVKNAKALSRALSFIPYVRGQRMMLLAVEPVYNFTRGETTDKSLKAVFWAAGDFDRLNDPDPDPGESGLIFCVPIFPVDGKVIGKAVGETREICERCGFEVAITINMIDAKASEAVVSIAFNRRDEKQTAAARTCISELENHYFENGFPLFRFRVDSMRSFVSETDCFWRTVRDLKKTLDPNNIIAPGRYSLS